MKTIDFEKLTPKEYDTIKQEYEGYSYIKGSINIINTVLLENISKGIEQDMIAAFVTVNNNKLEFIIYND